MGSERRGIRCKSCGASLDRWSARCPACEGWTSGPRSQASAHPPQPPQPPLRLAPPTLTVVREPVEAEPDLSSGELTAEPESVALPLSEVDVDDDHVRIRTGIEPLDRVLGGGLVADSLVILSGGPGNGKSSLLWRMLDQAQCTGVRLYATGEESVQQVTMTARRLGVANPDIRVVRETRVEAVLWHARKLDARIVVVDSINTAHSDQSRGLPGSDHQIKACCQILADNAKDHGVATFAISHVNKDGDVSGAVTLEHLGDVTLMLDRGIAGTEIGDPMRELWTKKNRFGSTTVRGVLQMTDRGLVAAEDVDPTEARSTRGRHGAGGDLTPIVHELLRRYLELGGQLDQDLRDRVAGRVDLDTLVR